MNHTIHTSTNDILDTNHKQARIYNNNNIDETNTSNSTHRKSSYSNDILELTMSKPDPPSGPGTSRRRIQRLKREGHQMQLGSKARTTISQLLHRKGQTQAPPDTDEQSLVLGNFHNAPLSARMHSPHVHPSVGGRGELDNECLYLQHPSCRLDLQSPMALNPISLNHTL